MTVKLFSTVLLWMINLHVVICAKDTIYVCRIADSKSLGSYSIDPDKKEDEVHVYTNPNGFSFYRHNKFWYLGDLNPWPPVTFYRCVSADHCNYDLDYPPDSTGAWSSKNGYGGDDLPIIQYEPCDENDNNNHNDNHNDNSNPPTATSSTESSEIESAESVITIDEL